MNIFISWSGELSHAVATALAGWLPQVINAAKPWLSSRDIEKGTRWFSEIGISLSQTEFGILCLTSTNLSAPWILFEAGALSRSLELSRVTPLLINVANADLQGPLTQFNTTALTRADIGKLIRTINSRLQEDQKRSDAQLDEAFSVWWPRLEVDIKKALSASERGESRETVVTRPKVEDVLDEVLELCRSISQQLQLAETRRRYTVEMFAAELKLPPELLIEQLRFAGVEKATLSDSVTERDKVRLLDYLRAMHGDSTEKNRSFPHKSTRPTSDKKGNS